MPRDAEDYRKPPEAGREVWNRFFCRNSEEHGPADTLISDFQPPNHEKINFYCLQFLVTAALGNETSRESAVSKQMVVCWFP